MNSLSSSPQAMFEARFQQAVCLHQSGALREAETAYEALLRSAPAHAQTLHLLGVVALQTGRAELAIERIRAAIQLDPRHPEPYSNLGLAQEHLGQFGSALASIEKALERAPNDPEIQANRGNLLRSLGRLEEACREFERALSVLPGSPQVLYNHGLALIDLGRTAEALASLDRALLIDPNLVEAYARRAELWENLGDLDAALANWQSAVKRRPSWGPGLVGRGMTLLQMRRLDEAAASIQEALRLEPHSPRNLTSMGCVLVALQRLEEGLACFGRALELEPGSSETWYHAGIALSFQKRFDEALACIERCVAIEPGSARAHFARAYLLQSLQRPQDAVLAYARVLELDPNWPFARGTLLHAQMSICDWSQFESFSSAIRVALREGRKVAEPFGYQAIGESPEDLWRVARLYCADRYPPAARAIWQGERYRHRRIRLGYVSGEFRSQATAILMTELFEKHDRGQFEIIAFDNGWDDGSDYRVRINSAFDAIVDISRLGDVQAAAEIRTREIDILVNLNGYFGFGRQGIFALRPAPIQVNYLGFPGTLGAAYMDYIIADHHIIAPEDERYFDERIVRLPDTYQVNDSQRPRALVSPGRSQSGLPETGFVFCCFNNSYKLTPQVFGVWAGLLEGVPGSVLWLLEDNAAASANLRETLGRRGVEPSRLVFAPRVELAEHLARHLCADLFLDTLPYNAHTTASDALWSGLPLVTCKGDTFPGRVAASLLSALGLPELVTVSLDDYAALALRLATTPALLGAVRAKLCAHRTTHPLFDSSRFRRHIEAAYSRMWRQHEQGMPPLGFSVEPLG